MYKDIFPKRDKSFLFLLFVSILCILFCIKSVYAEDSIKQDAKKSDPLPHEKYRKDFVYFPFGSGKTVILPLNVKESGNYKVNIVFEFINSAKKYNEAYKNNDRFFYLERTKQEQCLLGKNNNCPFSFKIKGYKKVNDNKELFFEQSYSYETYPQAATLARVSNEDNDAYRNRYNLFMLEIGKYEFEITDTSQEIEKFFNINSFISILKQDIYR